MMKLFGNCGGPAPGALPVLVGAPVLFCPVSAGQDLRVQQLASLVPSLAWPGVFEGMPGAVLPPFYRYLITAARGWLVEYRRGSP